MKSLSSPEATNEFKLKLRAGNCYSYTKVTYIDDDGLEVLFHDHAYPIKIEVLAEPPRYANTAYDPAAASCEFVVVNKNGAYSPKNSSSVQSGVLVTNRIFKFYDSKKLSVAPSPVEQAFVLSEFTPYFTKLLGGVVVPDVANLGGNAQTYLSDLFTNYGGSTYGGSEYAPSGYALFSFDLSTIIPRAGTVTTQTIKLTANSTYGRVFFRMGATLAELNAGNNNSSGWTEAGYTESGEVEFPVGLSNVYALQVIVLNEAPTWSADQFTISAVSFTYLEVVEWVLLGSFYLDDPKLQEKRGAALSEIKVTGRNAWKKALESKMNIRDLSGGVYIQDLVKEIFDFCGITYTVSSIADLSAYGARTAGGGYDDQVSASQILRDIMLIVGKEYRMRVDDNNVGYIELRPTAALADVVFHYRNYVQASQQYRSEKQLQRFTVFSDQQVLDVQVDLGAETVFTTEGVHAAITWSGKAIAKSWEIVLQSGEMRITDVVFTNTSAVFTTEGEGSITVQVTGNKFKTTDPQYVGEAANASNLQGNEGFSVQDENPLVISDAECKSIAEKKISEFGRPAYDIDVEWPYLFSLLEINDPALVYSKDFFEDGIYAVIGFTHELKSETDKFTTVQLRDTGARISDTGAIVYDRDRPPISGAAVPHDNGFIYDSRFGPSASQFSVDESVYNVFDLGYT